MTQDQDRPEPVDIDRSDFTMAFERDMDFDYGEPQSMYLDRRTGEVLWIYDSDQDAHSVINIPPEENREMRERVAAAPARYLQIPGLEHGDHHEILRDFLRSDWTEDDARWERTADAYTGSIGRWKRAVRDRDTVHAFYRFQERRIEELAEEFLRAHGIEPRWK